MKSSVAFSLVFATFVSNIAIAQNIDENATDLTPKQSFYGKVAGTVSDSTSSLINNAMQLIGVRYRYGDKVQTGFDASAFVKYVFKDNLGFLFPSKSVDMSKVGLQISRENLQPGDLVFFNTLQRENSHVGIYVGDNKFIHAPARGSGVRLDDMTTVYWNQRFDGARRVNSSQQLKVQQELTQ
jgi:cell wall-associated NlpC family hydrolase